MPTTVTFTRFGARFQGYYDSCDVVIGGRTVAAIVRHFDAEGRDAVVTKVEVHVFDVEIGARPKTFRVGAAGAEATVEKARAWAAKHLAARAA